MTEEEAAEAAKPVEPVKTIGDQRPAPATTVEAAADERKVS
jgi:hypothetical protein